MFDNPGYIVSFAIFGALYAIYFFHFNRTSEDEPEEAEPNTSSPCYDVQVDGPVISCSVCNTKNQRGYRFCRACIEELPGVDGGSDGSTPSKNDILPRVYSVVAQMDLTNALAASSE